jgi:hypothetical protein
LIVSLNYAENLLGLKNIKKRIRRKTKEKIEYAVKRNIIAN